jgi:hAT family C-terminal dimerisation region
MSSSVSSERAFSQGGITVSKHRNRLKGDIVEALQCIKSAIRQDLFQQPLPLSSEGSECDDEEDEADEPRKETGVDIVDVPAWDDIFVDDLEDDDAMDYSD